MAKQGEGKYPIFKQTRVDNEGFIVFFGVFFVCIDLKELTNLLEFRCASVSLLSNLCRESTHVL